MADAVDFYPPPPANVPASLTTPTPSYRARVIVVLTSLFLFVVLYVGLVAGSAYLCYWAFAGSGSSERQVISDQRRLNDISAEEGRILRVYNDAVQQVQRGTMDNLKFLNVLERDVLQPWQSQRQRLEKIKGLPAEEQRLVVQFGRYFQVREQGWELLVRANRENDGLAAEQANQKMREAEQLSRQLSADAGRLHSRPAPGRSDSRGWLVILGIASGVLCLFLVKGLFKRQPVDSALRVEVNEAEQPVLFAFLRRLCKDTGAPRPRRVYLTAEVNAAVFYNPTLLSLFLPTRKNLVIGLGLVNQLNLSEFKAVLAHEFGHFSQSSMKLGSYVYTSNRIIGDVVYGRDWLDSLVATLRGVDLRIAVFAWAFTGVLWGVRKTLQGIFQVINFTNSALSRQMEFNADLVAVSVTGSDALVHGLARLDFAGAALAQAWNDLTAAGDHGLYTRDLFYHQPRAGEYLRALRKNPRLGEPPLLPADPGQALQVFQPEDTSVPKMWATHPSNYDREVNAKRHYLRSPMDERSPWVLFQDAVTVREQVTSQLYQAARRLGDVRLEAPQVVQAFIDDEHAETTYHPRYHGLYDHRYLRPGDPEDVARTAPGELADAGKLLEAHAALYGDDVKARMETHEARHLEYNQLGRLLGGAVELTGKDFQFRGDRYRAPDARRLLEQVKKEIEQDFAWMSDLDRQSFLLHYEMARQVGEESRRELETLYRFHLAVQNIHEELSAHNVDVQTALAQLAGKGTATEGEFHITVAFLRNAYDSLSANLAAANHLRLPALKNLKPDEPLGPFLLSQPPSRPLSADENSLDGERINRFLGQMGEVLDKLQRIQRKSLGGILALQERIAERWTSERDSTRGT